MTARALPSRSSARLLALASLLTGAAAWAGPAIILYPSVGKPESVTLTGIVLKEAPSKGSSALSRNLRRLTVTRFEGASVEVAFGDQAQTVKSGAEGRFEVTFSSPKGEPYEAGTHVLTAKTGDVATQTAVQVLSPDAPFFVVSDFDDTVAVTNVISKRGLLKAALLSDADTQPAVPGMNRFYECLRQDKKAKPEIAFVSGSPVEFVPRISSFLIKNEIPFSGLYLRELGPKTLSGYKQPIIRSLMKEFPQHPVVLIGDSGEHDPEVYKEIREEFPTRVLAVYIRNAGRAEDETRFKDMMLFSDAADAARDAETKGFVNKACVEAAFKPKPAAVSVDVP